MTFRQTARLLSLFFDPGVTRVPLRVLRELSRRGIRRAPEAMVGDGANARFSLVRAFGLARRWLDGEMLTRHNRQWVLNAFLPPFPGRAYDRMFENLLSGRRLSPVSAYLAISGECPCACRHCSAKNRPIGNLPTDAWLKIVGELTGLGCSIVAFTGGEPLTRPDLPELVAAATGQGAATIVFTSGFGFDADKAARLRDAGLWALCVSLDHHRPELHDRFRGVPGAFDTAVRAVRLAVDTGFYVMTGSVATRDFIDEKRYLSLYALARSLGVSEFRIVEPMPCGKFKDADENALLTPDRVRALRDFHVSINRKGRSPKVCAFNHIESPELFGCGGGTQHLYIDSAGKVCPCDFTPLSFGEAVYEPLAAIWARMNDAMGNPRRDCFVQKHYKAIQRRVNESGQYPLSPELSEALCREVGPEPLPDYFAMVMGRPSGDGD